MTAIVLKDLIQQVRPWLAITSATVATLVAAYLREISEERTGLIAGFVQGLIVCSGLVFVYLLVESERKKRHFILLKTLPVADWKIVAAKFTAAWILTLSVANITFLARYLLNNPFTFSSVLSTNGLLLAYTSILLAFTISFRSLLATFVPFYLIIILVLLQDTRWLIQAVSHLEDGPFGSAVWLLLAVATALASVAISVFVFQRKELDF